MNSPSPYPNVLQLRCSRNPLSSPCTRAETITLRRLRHLIYVEDSPEYRSLSQLDTAYRALFDSYTIAHEHAWYMRKTKDAGRLVSTVDYVINLAEKHQGLIQKISLSLGELVEDKTAIFSDTLAKEDPEDDFKCHGLLDQMASHSAYILIAGGLGTYLLAQFHSEPLVLWLIMTILAYILFESFRLLRRLKKDAAIVSRELYMFVAARMELAEWIGSLAELRGTADCRSKISVATNNLGKFRVIFDDGLEDLFSTRDVFSDNYRVWNELPSHPLPAAGETPPHRIAHTHDLPTGRPPPSIATYSGSVKECSDDHAMRAKDRAGLTADHYV
ncbi:hypothetical protein EV421DRAFT_2043499 [Armillaria borealis]|uniref:Uncharacterized protein n=1 Tax=Armillaria borealis TaxID=47425 RepID=A0AA39IC63_9AGAR|nr:hypothetical protein EV421DRAFT_2043499 [Armillaria borealis]